MSGWWQETLHTPEQQANTLKSKIDAWTLSKEELDKLTKELNTPEMMRAIQSAISEKSAETLLHSIQQKDPLSENDRGIVRLLSMLYPEKTLTTQLISTNKPSGKISALLLKWGETLNLEEIKKLKPEGLQEFFKTLNKWDITKIVGTVDAMEWNEDLKKNLKNIISAVLTTLVQNGMSIESPLDIKLLKENGSEEIKKYIAWSESGEGILKNYVWATKLIIKTNTTWEIEIKPLMDMNTRRLSEWFDIAKLNTIDTKKSVEQIKKELPPWLDTAKMEDMVRNLLDSKSSALRGLGEFFKIFGALFGLNFDKKITPEVQGESFGKKQKYELMKDMLNPKDKRYDIDGFFRNGIFIGQDDQKVQRYLKDIAKLQLFSDGIPEQDKEKWVFVYNEKLTLAIKEYQKNLKLEPTGILDKKWITIALTRYDANGEILSTPEASIASKSETQNTAQHPQSELMKKLKGKEYGQIKNDRTLVKEIQWALWLKQDGAYGTKTKEAIKKLQGEIGMDKKEIDGLIGKKTIESFFKKFGDKKID